MHSHTTYLSSMHQQFVEEMIKKIESTKAVDIEHDEIPNQEEMHKIMWYLNGHKLTETEFVVSIIFQQIIGSLQNDDEEHKDKFIEFLLGLTTILTDGLHDRFPSGDPWGTIVEKMVPILEKQLQVFNHEMGELVMHGKGEGQDIGSRVILNYFRGLCNDIAPMMIEKSVEAGADREEFSEIYDSLCELMELAERLPTSKKYYS